MAIRVVVDEPEERKKIPDWADVAGNYSDAQTAAAVAKAQKLPGSLADPNMIQVPWPVLVMPVTAAALDFGNATQATVALGQLIASQTWILLDRLLAHIQNPGKRGDDKKSPFVSLPITTEGCVIVDGHHSLTALWLLNGSDFEVPVWFVPVGLATGHPR